MKTREQLLYEMAVTVHETVLANTFDTTEKLLDLVVGACEEAVNQELSSIFLSKHIDHTTLITMNFLAKHMREKILENLKKLKSK